MGSHPVRLPNNRRDPETSPVGESLLSPGELKTAESAVVFSDHVKPILEGHCLYCHDGKEMPGKFSFATRDAAFQGKQIVPGNADASSMIIALTTGNHALSTAPSPEEVEVLKCWINQGADWPK